MSSTLLVNAGVCPFCRDHRLWIWDKGMPGKFAVCCSNPACAATGPMAETEAEAVMGWNMALRPGEAKPNRALGRTLDEMHEPRR